MNSKITHLISWIVTLLTPIALLGLTLRILLSPIFYNLEYRLPYFPPDEYGFTVEDRLQYAPFAVDFLLNNENISYLGELNFPNGEPLFNARELSHMLDVKVVTKGALQTWYLVLFLLLGFGGWAWFGKWWQVFLRGLWRGGWLLIGLVAGVGLFGALAFWQLFTLFHSLFFEGDSWLFLYSDTLIRLFPMQFWQDAFLWAGVISVGGALGLALGLKEKYSQRKTD